MAAYKLKQIKTHQDAVELLKEIKRLADTGLYAHGQYEIYNIYCRVLYTYVVQSVSQFLQDSLRVNMYGGEFGCHGGFNSVGFFELIVFKKGEDIYFGMNWVDVELNSYLCNESDSMFSSKNSFSIACHYSFEEALVKIDGWRTKLAPILKEIKAKNKNTK